MSPGRAWTFLGRVAASTTTLLTRSSGALVLANLGVSATSVISGIITSRVLQPKLRGDLAVITTWALVVAIVADLGISETITVRVGRDPRALRAAVRAGLVVAVLCSLVGVGLGYVSMPFLLRPEQALLLPAARAFLVYVPATFLSAIATGTLLGLRQYGRVALLRVAGAVGFLVFAIGIAWMGRGTPMVFAWMTAGAVSAPFVIGAPWVIGAMRAAGRSPDSTAVSEQLRAGLRLQGTRLVERFGTLEDRAVANVALSQSGIGLYQIPAALAIAIQSFSTAKTQWLFSRMPAALASERGALVVRAYARSVLWTGLACAVCLPLVPFLVPVVYGVAFAPAVAAAMIVLFAAPIEAGAAVLRGAARTQLGVRDPLVAEIGGIVIMAGVALALADAIGPTGVAIGYLAGRSSSLGWMVAAAPRLFGLPREVLRPWSAGVRNQTRSDMARVRELMRGSTGSGPEPTPSAEV